MPVLLLMQTYVAAFAITGCYLTARMAPSHPMRHALILGALGLAFSTVGSITLWDTAPVWYHVVALARVMPRWRGSAAGCARSGHTGRRALAAWAGSTITLRAAATAGRVGTVSEV